MYRKWCPGYPDAGEGKFRISCVAFNKAELESTGTSSEVSGSGVKGCFTIESCETPFAFVCEKPAAENPVLRIGKVADLERDNWKCEDCDDKQKKKDLKKKLKNKRKMKRKSLQTKTKKK